MKVNYKQWGDAQPCRGRKPLHCTSCARHRRIFKCDDNVGLMKKPSVCSEGWWQSVSQITPTVAGGVFVQVRHYLGN